MNHDRWCIIASPRSGSTWLENMIYKSIQSRTDRSKIMLGEFLHASHVGYQDDRKPEESFVQDWPWDRQERLFFYNKVCDEIQNSNDAYTIRVFPQTQHVMHDYKKFFAFLTENRFKFIRLNRGIFERVISLCVAQQTNLWHRSFNSQSSTVEYDSSGDILPVSSRQPIIVHPTYFTRNYIDIKLVDYFISTTTEGLDMIEINYSNLLEDCANNGIQFTGSASRHIKTYDEPYKKIIGNFDELIELHSGLENFLKKNYNG